MEVKGGGGGGGEGEGEGGDAGSGFERKEDEGKINVERKGRRKKMKEE